MHIEFDPIHIIFQEEIEAEEVYLFVENILWSEWQLVYYFFEAGNANAVSNFKWRKKIHLRIMDIIQI